MGKTKAVKPVTTKKKTAVKANIGLIGIAVMGENLVLNMESKGFKIAVFNRTVDKVDNFVKGRGKGKNIVGCHTIEKLVENLATPRKIMLMVKAGKPVDDFIEQLIPLLDKGDIIIDGGNSHFPDTIRRTKYLESKKLLFIGTGVSGGEEGALLGPSIMPGGSPKAWPAVKPIFQAISAKVDDGAACCEWVGSDGAGHYVKTVHNGIEYGDMQMICEAYTMMKNLLGMSAKEMQKVFAEWNKAELDSYLIDITANILKVVDSKTKKPLVDLILDTAGQKGTGKWTSMSALDLGAPSPTIAEAVFARCVSAIKDERVAASKILKGPKMQKFSATDKNVMIDKIRQALYASKICSYAQGFQLLALAQEEYGWKLNFGEIALMWRGGCIIRAKFLGDIKDAFEKDPKLANLLLASFFKKAVNDCQSAWRDVVAAAAVNGIPVPAFSSALSYYDSYRSAVLPANLLQAQRDYFGAHTFERTDEPRGKFFHHEWTETSGSTTSTTYNA